MLRNSVLIAPFVTLAFLASGCCPLFPPPSNSNGNANQNTSNGNQNTNVNGNANANGNQNANVNANANENVNGNANQNVNGNQNQNSANQNENASGNQNTNVNGNTNANANENTNGNANENTNGNGNANNNTNENSSGLSFQEQTAVTEVTLGLAAFGSAFNAFASVGTTTVDFDNLTSVGDYNGPPDEGSSGLDCPIGIYGSGNPSQFNTDFGAGCFTDRTNDETVSGQINMSYNRTTHVGTVSFSNLVVNGNAVTGDMTLTLTNGGLDGFFSYTGTVNVTVGTIGTVTGTVDGTFTFNNGMHALIMNAVDLSVVRGGTTRTVDLVGLTIDPLTEPNFGPRAGTATIDQAGLDTLVVQYSDMTPDNGIVSVTAGADPSVTFDIPGLGS